MEQVSLLNSNQLIQLAGLAAGADDKHVLIFQQVPDEEDRLLNAAFTPPLRVQRVVSGDTKEYVMTATGLHMEKPL